MTAEEKQSLAAFLDLAGDYLRDGYRRDHGPYEFTDGDAGGLREPAAPVAAGDSLERVAAEITACQGCGLSQERTNAVPGEGPEKPLVMVIGEGPGADEDATGRPFVGKAGQLLDRMLASIGLFRDKNCFIANVVKCRPPNNRDPLPDESAACAGFLARQIALLNPRVIFSIGRVPTQTLLATSEGIGRLRGRFTEYRGIPLLPSYHPSALLRDESLKRPAWEDLKTLRTKLCELDETYARESGGAP
ncbi:uracil-DNA glycosylase [Breznakiella homolactica]|uniref:Type-4 uracil-DNA glycosylase n=1 Tax=Breznakiella homolactica TaxID=2798577 RepID=A0A7T8B9S3_9SPIR|nr:uracil-DNA glycosylase [Breznakiella homolactica]QQO07488.1 uracil-DNA glycosylase [Breznakiella homolactica]